MKILIERALVIIAFIIITVLSPKQIQAQKVVVSVQVFYDELSPYGQWVNYPAYGYVWIPIVDADFFPYSSKGHWCYTYYGWTWVSYYSWGWAPFHYGRWDYDPFYGWFWVPDIEWGPAWVIWRKSPGYYGWTHLRPGHNHKKLADNTYYGPRKDWTFVEEKYLGRNDVENYYAPRTNNESLINTSVVVGNIHEDKDRNVTYIKGPGKDELEKSTGIAVNMFSIEENSKPGPIVTNNNKLNIYRPTVVNGIANETKPAPAKVVELKEVKPVMERNKTAQPGGVTLPDKSSPTPVNDNVKPSGDIQKSKPVENNPRTQPVKNHPVLPKSQVPKVDQPKQQNTTQPNKVAPNFPAPKNTAPKIDPQKPQNVPQPQRANPPAQQSPKPNTAPTKNTPASEKKARPQSVESEMPR